MMSKTSQGLSQKHRSVTRKRIMAPSQQLPKDELNREISKIC